MADEVGVHVVHDGQRAGDGEEEEHAAAAQQQLGAHGALERGGVIKPVSL